jgi:hypothetical protein
MKIAYQSFNFRGASLKLIEQCNTVVEELRDGDIYDEARTQEQTERDEIRVVSDQWDEVVEHAQGLE